MKGVARHTSNKPNIKLIMKKIIFAIISVPLFVVTNAQNVWHLNNGIHPNVDIIDGDAKMDFNAVEVHAASNIELMQGDTNYVSLSSKDSVVKTPKMEVVDGVLEINSSFHHGKITVHVKNIKSIKVDEAAKVTCIDTLTADNLSIHVKDAGSAEIMVHAKNLDVRGSDASYIKLSGSADTMDVKVSDASHIDAANLKSLHVSATSADGSFVGVWAINSIDANATDGSTINVRGTPAQKNTSASDGGAVKAYNSAWVMPRRGAFDIVQKDTNVEGKVVHTIKGDGFIGFGFVTGGSNGLNIKYGRSREFIIGFGNAYPIWKRDLIGVDLYYKSTDFYLAKNSFINNDSNTHYQAQKISLQNFGGLLYDRVWFGKQSFIDAGIYGDWTFHSKLITWDNNNPDVSYTKTILTNLSYINSGNYGVTIRYMPAIGVMFYFNYRLSPVFQNTFAGYQNPKLPNCVFGVTFGF